MEILKEISENVQKGRAPKVKELTEKALVDRIEAKKVLNEGLLSGMEVIGERFKRNEAFVPEVLVAARAMNEGTKILEKALLEAGVEPIGKAVIGTVKGDLHDIGKNIVAMMLKGAGFEVIDLGINVEKDKFIQTMEEKNADILVMSALLTTTMPYMKEVIDELEKRGIRNNYKVMVGGAPVTQAFADEIKADIYTGDAATCATTAKDLVA